MNSSASRCTSGARGDSAGAAERWELLASDTHSTTPQCISASRRCRFFLMLDFKRLGSHLLCDLLLCSDGV